MTLFSSKQSLGWRLDSGPVYEDDRVIGIRGARKDRDYQFWESPRMAFCPPIIGLSERDPVLVGGVEPEVEPPTGPNYIVDPILTGTNLVGSLMTTTNGQLVGSATIVFSYDWKRDGNSIGATDQNTYTTVAADDDTTLTVTITATNDEGNDSATSNGIDVGIAALFTVDPAVTGTVLVGSMLTTDNGTVIGTAPINYFYNWKRDGVSIGAADQNTYTIVAADDDTTLTVEITAINTFGSDAATSNGIGAGTMPLFTIDPVLSGTNLVGSLMSVTDGTVTGTAPITLSYDWKRDAVSIGAADQNTYTTVAGDDLTELTCEITATNSFGNDSATSNGIDIGIAALFTADPVLSGDTDIGDLLTVTNGTVVGSVTILYSYDWKRDAVSIGATDQNTYTTVMADDSTNITCEITATNDFGNDSATSNAIAVAGTIPVFTVDPVLSGGTGIDELLSVTNGTVTGTATITYSYDWKRDAVSIGATDQNTYTTVEADEDTDLTCEVTATNSFGSDSATSNSISIVGGFYSTLGTVSIGASSIGIARNNYVFKKISMIDGQVLTGISAHVETNSASSNLVAIIYSDDSGSPSDIVGIGYHPGDGSINAWDGSGKRWLSWSMFYHATSSEDIWISLFNCDDSTATLISYEATGGADHEYSAGSDDFFKDVLGLTSSSTKNYSIFAGIIA